MVNKPILLRRRLKVSRLVVQKRPKEKLQNWSKLPWGLCTCRLQVRLCVSQKHCLGKEKSNNFAYYCRIAVTILLIPPPVVDSFARKAHIGNCAASSERKGNHVYLNDFTQPRLATIVLVR